MAEVREMIRPDGVAAHAAESEHDGEATDADIAEGGDGDAEHA